MFKLYMGYFATNANEIIIKVGKTTKTCWSRCKNEDYIIFQAVGLRRYHCLDIPSGLCDFLEAAMIYAYRNKYPKYKGNEYFKITDKTCDEIEAEWCDILQQIIKQIVPMISPNDWVWYEGEVGPYTY